MLVLVTSNGSFGRIPSGAGGEFGNGGFEMILAVCCYNMNGYIRL